jgi:hypothetical protein
MRQGGIQIQQESMRKYTRQKCDRLVELVCGVRLVVRGVNDGKSSTWIAFCAFSRQPFANFDEGLGDY